MSNFHENQKQIQRLDRAAKYLGIALVRAILSLLLSASGLMAIALLIANVLSLMIVPQLLGSTVGAILSLLLSASGLILSLTCLYVLLCTGKQQRR